MKIQDYNDSSQLEETFEQRNEWEHDEVEIILNLVRSIQRNSKPFASSSTSRNVKLVEKALTVSSPSSSNVLLGKLKYDILNYNNKVINIHILLNYIYYRSK